MLPDRVSNPGPLTYESGALPIALRDPAHILACFVQSYYCLVKNYRYNISRYVWRIYLYH